MDTASVLAEMMAHIREAVAPKKIILFGHRVRGEAHAGSDFDLLIIAPSTLPRRQRISPYRLLAGLGVPEDIVWWTPEGEGDRGMGVTEPSPSNHHK